MTQGFTSDTPISTDTGLQPESNGLVPSQLAVKTYVDSAMSWMQQGNNCFFRNLSFTHAAGALTLAGADGTALSATNPGYVSMPSNATAGEMVLHEITANKTWTVSDMDGCTFQTTAAVAWGSSMPMYIGFMADSVDANLVMTVSRLGHLDRSPSASANIGDPSAANADVEYSVFSTTDITEANYQSMQLGIIGSLTATKAVTTDAWTLDALTYLDGAGKFNDNRVFDVPAGQNAAVSGTFIKDSGGGTHPIFAGQFLRYTISRGGLCWFSLGLTTCTTPGVGTNTQQPILPFDVFQSGALWFQGVFRDNSATNTEYYQSWAASAGNSYVTSQISNANSTPWKLQDTDTGDAFKCYGTYPLTQSQ